MGMKVNALVVILKKEVKGRELEDARYTLSEIKDKVMKRVLRYRKFYKISNPEICYLAKDLLRDYIDAEPALRDKIERIMLFEGYDHDYYMQQGVPLDVALGTLFEVADLDQVFAFTIPYVDHVYDPPVKARGDRLMSAILIPAVISMGAALLSGSKSLSELGEILLY